MKGLNPDEHHWRPGRMPEVALSTTTDIKRLDKKLEMSLQKEGKSHKLEVWLTEPYVRLCQMP